MSRDLIYYRPSGNKGKSMICPECKREIFTISEVTLPNGVTEYRCPFCGAKVTPKA